MTARVALLVEFTAGLSATVVGYLETSTKAKVYVLRARTISDSGPGASSYSQTIPKTAGRSQSILLSDCSSSTVP